MQSALPPPILNTNLQNNNETINVIRALAMDAVQQAKSGHPGMPMGMAEIAEVLWRRYLKHNPKNPGWYDRDRFVLSNGHGSMLLYAVLHLTGYDISIDDLKQFRQLNSKTPGHPEHGITPGVETTTGPLGQGIGNAVGMAIAEKILADRYNRVGHTIVDHFTYAFVGDGCLMEGISHEVCSLAGTLGLGKLIVFWDDNKISIDGPVEGWFSDNTVQRFEAYNWHVISDIDGHDTDAIEKALLAAQTEKNRPSLIACRTIIGKGSPNKQGTADAHGAPLGSDEIIATREAIGWHHPPFVIPDEIKAIWDHQTQGQEQENEWNSRLAAYQSTYPELAAEFVRVMEGKLPGNWKKTVSSYAESVISKAENIATRKASQNALNALAPVLPELVGGSADLTGSNLTLWSGSKAIHKGNGGNYLFFGVREFGMTAIANGIALHGGCIPYTATFLIFSDYARNAIRLAALMKQRHIMIYTHDSIGLGEDGPTHQPVEQLASLRLIPGVDVWRPADAFETAHAWAASIERSDGPSILALSRQNLPTVTGGVTAEMIRRGAYILADVTAPQLVLIATGSEVKLALETRKMLAEQGIASRVVSMPSTSIFDRQDRSYQMKVLPEGIPRIAIEAAHADFWYKYVGTEGTVVGLTTFGASAPAQQLFDVFGFTIAHIVEIAIKTLERIKATKK